MYTEINGEEYILISNAQQLEAIGTDAQAAHILFLRTEAEFLVGLVSKTTLIPYYPGDADLTVKIFKNTGIAYEGIESDVMDFQYFKQHPTPVGLWSPDFDNPGLIRAVAEILGDFGEGSFLLWSVRILKLLIAKRKILTPQLG